MKSVSIYSKTIAEFENVEDSGSFLLEDYPINVGLLEEDDLTLADSEDPHNRVLVKKKAFSCNYRDKTLILKYNQQIKENEEKDIHMFSYIGSEFVGEVIDIGKNVTAFQIGDMVVPNISYPSYSEGYIPGLPSNHSSRRIDDFVPNKLLKVSKDMPLEIAAALPIAGFTSYSMIRKVVKPKAKVLVTAAKSNTSIAAISALRNYDVEVYAMTSSNRGAQLLSDLGVKDILIINTELDSFLDDPVIKKKMMKIGAFDAVIDPLFDIYLPRVIELMGIDGRYVTCGLYNQYQDYLKKDHAHKGMKWDEIMVNAMSKNISLIGNCIGLESDGKKAIEDYMSGKFEIPLDKVYGKGEEKEFFDLTYNFNNRLGKVVYIYED